MKYYLSISSTTVRLMMNDVRHLLLGCASHCRQILTMEQRSLSVIISFVVCLNCIAASNFTKPWNISFLVHVAQVTCTYNNDCLWMITSINTCTGVLSKYHIFINRCCSLNDCHTKESFLYRTLSSWKLSFNESSM